jgi:hypothetical protein
MTTRAPNEQEPRTPDPDGPRNDYGIDPDGELPEGTEGADTASEAGTDSGDPSTPEGNTFSPDFEPEQDEETLTKPKDTDIETDGG